MKLDTEKVKASKQYVSGMKLSKEAIRKYKYELCLDDVPFFKETFYSEVLTKKKDGVWQKGVTSFYFNDSSRMFNSVIELLESKYELINL